MKAIIGEYSTDIRPTKEEVKELCKPGEGANTCIWLMVDGDGMYCAFYNRPGILVERWKAGLNTELKELSAPIRGLLPGRGLFIVTDYCFDCGTGYVVRAFESGPVAPTKLPQPG